MINYRPLTFLLLLQLCLFTGCVEPYDPAVRNSAGDFLVVDGLVNISDPGSAVTLSRTQQLSGEEERVFVTDAKLMLETGTGDMFPLISQGNGQYLTGGIDFSSYGHCRLRIKTADGKEYESDYTPILRAPEIDSISWEADQEGFHIRISTHDPENSTFYYRWELIETVHYKSSFYSNYILDKSLQEVVFRPQEEQIYNCWKTHQYDQIMVGTSNGLQEDVISKQRLLSLSPDSWKLGIKYSALVKQYALSREAYEYWDHIKKSTEEVGSLFDPQPSAIEGNIRCITDPNEPVMGFFSLSSATEMRTFVSVEELPDWARELKNQDGSCHPVEIDTILVEDLPDHTGKLLINAIAPFGQIIGYETHYNSCIDCRISKRGTNKKPDFWE